MQCYNYNKYNIIKGKVLNLKTLNLKCIKCFYYYIINMIKRMIHIINITKYDFIEKDINIYKKVS